MHSVLATVDPGLCRIPCIVISKSDGTKQTRNRILIAKAACEQAGFDFAASAVTTTMTGSDLDKNAVQNKWILCFPISDSVGGRASVLLEVSLLSAALQRSHISGLLSVVCQTDKLTSPINVKVNPTRPPAWACFVNGNGTGVNTMVVFPYKSGLEPHSEYLQHLVAESLTEELDLNRNVANQGLTVYANRESTCRNACVPQLRDGANDLFAKLIEVLDSGLNSDIMVEDDLRAGAPLHGSILGTRQALGKKDRESSTATINEVSIPTLGALTMLFEGGVGSYTSVTNTNGCHQPGVEACIKAAQDVIDIQRENQARLLEKSNKLSTTNEKSQLIDCEYDTETTNKVIQALTANKKRCITKVQGRSFLHFKFVLN